MIGNAVPVNLAKYLAETINQQLKQHSISQQVKIEKQEAVTV
jgi:hypothetical protein